MREKQRNCQRDGKPGGLDVKETKVILQRGTQGIQREGAKPRKGRPSIQHQSLHQGQGTFRDLLQPQ